MTTTTVNPPEPVVHPPVLTQGQTIERLQHSVSPSRLSLFQSCRLRFFFRHVLRIEKPKVPALHLGSTVHGILSLWNRARWRGQTLTARALHEVYHEMWNSEQAITPVTWENPAAEVEQRTLGWRLLEVFLRESSLLHAGKPEGVEVFVEADLSQHGLPSLVGTLDLVQDGCVVEFKTTAATPHPERAALLTSTQAAAYALLYRDATGNREQGVELHYLIKLKQPKLVVIAPAPITAREEHRLLHVIEAYVGMLQRQEFIPSPGLHCATCEFAHECQQWP